MKTVQLAGKKAESRENGMNVCFQKMDPFY